MRYYFFSHTKTLVILNFKCGMSSLYSLTVSDKKRLTFKTVNDILPSHVKQTVFIYRCPIRRFVSFFINWAYNEKHRSDNNSQFHKPIKEILDLHKYQTLMDLIYANDSVSAIKLFFSFIDPSETIFQFCTVWKVDPHTVSQRDVVDNVKFKPSIYIDLDGGSEQIKKYEQAIGHSFNHKNKSSKELSEKLVQVCINDNHILNVLKRSYHKDYLFFNKHFISWDYYNIL